MFFSKRSFRSNFIFGFIGVNKTGKSSTVLEIAKAWKKNNKKKKIWAYDPQRIFYASKIIDKFLDISSENWASECCELRNGLLIIDEIKLLMPNPQHTPKEVSRLLINCFFWNLDIIFTTHNPSLIPEIFSFYTTHLFIFLTFTKSGGFSKKTPNSYLNEKAGSTVNKYVSIHGRGKHKEDINYEGQDFPFAIVDNENQKINYINMNKK